MLWEIKTIGLAVIFVYAFFKFAWSYRLFNYVAIMIGAMPPHKDRNKPSAKSVTRCAPASCATSAGRHFNRGQRAFFFALGYLGWFISPWLFMATTLAIVIVMWRRQFRSDSREAVMHRVKLVSARRDQQSDDEGNQHDRNPGRGHEKQRFDPLPSLFSWTSSSTASTASGKWLRHIKRHRNPLRA